MVRQIIGSAALEAELVFLGGGSKAGFKDRQKGGQNGVLQWLVPLFLIFKKMLKIPHVALSRHVSPCFGFSSAAFLC